MSHASPFSPTALFTTLVVLAIEGGVAGLIPVAHARTDASQVDSTLLFNQKFFGLIANAGDEDVVQFSEVKGSKLTLTMQRDGANSLVPNVDLLDSNFQPINTLGFETNQASKAEIKNFVVPANGIYYARMTSANGFTGTYKFTLKGKPPKDPKIPPGSIGSTGEVDTLLFSARGGSKLSGTLSRTSGNLQPLVIELVSPTGVLVPIGGVGKVKTNAAGTVVTLSNIGLPSLGDYQLRITGQGGSTGGYAVDFKIQPAKPATDSIYEDEFPNPGVDDSPTITLKEIYFGRGLHSEDGKSMQVVSPFTTVLTDPVSDLPVNGSLTPIFPGIDVKTPVSFDLDTFYAPMIVPRNAVLLLRFNRAPSIDSLRLDSDGLLTTDSPLKVTISGQLTPFAVIVKGNDLLLDPVFGDNVGMPASPLAVDGAGNPIASVTGAGLIAIEAGPNGLKASDGGVYKPRADLLASPDSGGQPVGFNPGNQVLDFFKQSSVGGASKSYSGFLPDEAAPRIVREKKKTGNYTPNFLNPTLGDIQTSTVFSIVTNYALDVSQNGGKGEYAGGVLRLRPQGPNREEHVILSHTVLALQGGVFRNEFVLASKIQIPAKAPAGSEPGDSYEIVRAEYYEPDPEHPIDPKTFDPNDPDLGENVKIENFVEAVDRNGNLEDISQALDPKSTLTMRFSEPMLRESFSAYDSYFVTDDPAASNPGLAYIGRVVSSDRGKAMTFQPYREIQFGPNAGSIEQLGFGPNASALRLHLFTVPSSAILISLLGEQGFADFVSEGHRGATDLGGQPLAFPLGFVSQQQPFLDYAIPFTTVADPTIPDTGAIVHRFRGQPSTGSDVNGDTGVSYNDMPTSICGPLGNLYGPRIADVNLFTNGFLSGAPVAFFQKVHDDFNLPPNGQMNPFAGGAPQPIGGNTVLGGGKLQHVYRSVDCSPDFESLAGTILDLYRVDYAPVSGLVQNTVIPDVSIHAGHTATVPDTSQTTGIPDFAASGLNGGGTPSQWTFGGNYTTLGDPNTPLVEGSYNATLKETGEALTRQLCYGTPKPDTLADFYDGKPVVIDAKNLYNPAASASRTYHPLPVGGFDNPFPYNNGALDTLTYPNGVTFGQPFKNRSESLLLEYRVRVVDSANPPGTQNSFTFAVGILSSALPRFRIYTVGQGCTSCSNGVNCAVSYGPPMTGLPNGGGPPLDPDLMVNAIGPDVSFPGLACICYAPPINPIPCAPGFNSTAITSPDAAQIAQGQGQYNSANNWGDNARYFMVFNYVKRESLIRSPFVRVQPVAVTDPIYLEPIFDPPLSQLPVGTKFDIQFRASSNGQGTFDATSYVAPDQIGTLNGAARPFLQFQALIDGDTSTQLVPAFDSIVIPFRKN